MVKNVTYKLRCRRCHHEWRPRKRTPKFCPECHIADYEKITEFMQMKEKIRRAGKKKYSRSIKFYYPRKA